MIEILGRLAYASGMKPQLLIDGGAWSIAHE